MELDSARDLKAALWKSVVEPLSTSAAVRSAGVQATPMEALSGGLPSLALGLVRAPGRAKNDFRLAVRVQSRGLENGPQVEAIRKRAKGEIDVRYIGVPNKRAAIPWTQKTVRPLRIGASVGHFKITAGTIGAFVKDRADGTPLLLSNNHVLANENKAKKGDAILQPGPIDNGEDPRDKIGALLRFIRLKREGTNLVDAAVASLDAGIAFDARTITGVGKLAGLGDALLSEGDTVMKVGRTTGKSEGRVTAFELDGVFVRFSLGVLAFDNQFEIEGAGDEPFSQGGDSGSLILDADRRAVGLLFAGGDQGGTNGKGLTFANPLRAALDALKVDLMLT